MSKTAALGTILNLGINQTTSTPIVGTLTQVGNATVTITKAGMTGSPLTVTTASIPNLSIPEVTATAMVTALNLNANFNAKCVAWCSGTLLYVSTIIAAANDGTMNIAYTNGTCLGLTPDATSDVVFGGVVPTAIAYVGAITGPSLKVDVKDVTTQDSTSSFEESVVTVLRGNQVKFGLIYDPNAATHKNAAGGLLYYFLNKTLLYIQLVFPGPYTWAFSGKITEFEPDEPVDGALTAKCAFDMIGAPVLV